MSQGDHDLQSSRVAEFRRLLAQTMSGLPERGPEVRAAVYDRARASIQRTIDKRAAAEGKDWEKRLRAALEAAVADVEAEHAQKDGRPVAEAVEAVSPAQPPSPEPSTRSPSGRRRWALGVSAVAAVAVAAGLLVAFNPFAGGTGSVPPRSVAEEDGTQVAPSMPRDVPAGDPASVASAPQGGPDAPEASARPDGSVPLADDRTGRLELSPADRTTPSESDAGPPPKAVRASSDLPPVAGTPSPETEGGSAQEAQPIDLSGLPSPSDASSPSTVPQGPPPESIPSAPVEPEVVDGGASSVPAEGQAAPQAPSSSPETAEGPAPEAGGSEGTPPEAEARVYAPPPEEPNVVVARLSDGVPGVSWAVAREPAVGTDVIEDVAEARVRVPAQGVDLTVYVRRNADPTIPAIGIVEMIFREGSMIEGRGIESVGAAVAGRSGGNASDVLVAFPVEVGTDHFVMTLTSVPPARDRNLELLGQAEWLDFPVTLDDGSTRRIRVETGARGSEVVRDVLAGWPARQP